MPHTLPQLLMQHLATYSLRTALCQELYGIAIDEQRIIEVFFVFPYEIRQILRLFDSFGVVLDPSFEVVGHILDLIQRFLPKNPYPCPRWL